VNPLTLWLFVFDFLQQLPFGGAEYQGPMIDPDTGEFDNGG